MSESSSKLSMDARWTDSNCSIYHSISFARGSSSKIADGRMQIGFIEMIAEFGFQQVELKSDWRKRKKVACRLKAETLYCKPCIALQFHTAPNQPIESNFAILQFFNFSTFLHFSFNCEKRANNQMTDSPIYWNMPIIRLHHIRRTMESDEDLHRSMKNWMFTM